MADQADISQEKEQMSVDSAVNAARKRAAEMPPGNAGECDFCGSRFARLVGGACGRCRDEYRLD